MISVVDLRFHRSGGMLRNLSCGEGHLSDTREHVLITTELHRDVTLCAVQRLPESIPDMY